jgi:dihydroorotate dehydrogenase
MIQLTNDYSFDFAVASGALGFDGRGWWWEKPLRWLGLIDPRKFLVITKTLTRHPRRGNLRWWCPWRCVRPVHSGFVNAVALTNPGLDGWFQRYYRHVVDDNLDIAVSIAPETVKEAKWMAMRIMAGNHHQRIKAIELNLSCPNANCGYAACKTAEDMVMAMHSSGLPIILKLGYQQPFVQICMYLDGLVDAYDLINAVPWDIVYPNLSSPLAHLGGGGVSGFPIVYQSLRALRLVKSVVLKTPVISGGGVVNLEQVRSRFKLGADAVAFGSIFLRHPTLPNKIVHEWRTAA